ncbi:MAG: CDGSH iron-sulfur domain-containing protein [Acidobacteria bacterium]|nr:MAG: CDGSH iron-sulfur domain-containing protein [Acidobacteriota bacterium]REK07844.1 MAG: CDGSH iron-sulfur domain-containing protein [Acidobacteriota bacterium]
MKTAETPARRRPVLVQVAAGTYFWCRCGATAHPPFCDGSHRAASAGDVGPLRWKLDEDRELPLCRCRKAARPVSDVAGDGALGECADCGGMRAS